MAQTLTQTLYTRILPGAGTLALVMGVGTYGFHTIGAGHWSWGDCFYMTVITLSTVGFGEVLDGMGEHPGARAWTMLLILLGSGTLVYFASVLTAFVLEGDLTDVLRRRKMQTAIDALTGHVVVSGLGFTGRHVVEELVATKTAFVVIERDAERVAHVTAELGRDVPHILGDATDDAVLEHAGIRRAKGLIASLHDDRDNLFVTLSARGLNEGLRIVAKADDPANAAKLRRAGADAVVMPSFIGGMRIASEMLRPSVVRFLDDMLRDRDTNFRIEEVVVPATASIAGAPIARTNVREQDVLLVSVRDPGGTYHHNPPGDTVIVAGASLVVLGRVDAVRALRDAIASGRVRLSRAGGSG